MVAVICWTDPAAIDGFFANLDDYRKEIESLITDNFHFIGKLNPQAP